jgi:hypothetical protein
MIRDPGPPFDLLRQYLTGASSHCLACKGSGIHGGPGGYYDAPGRGKPCAVCHGAGSSGD